MTLLGRVRCRTMEGVGEAPPAVGPNTCKPGGMNTQSPQTAVSITDKFAATAELAELLSSRDADSAAVARNVTSGAWSRIGGVGEHEPLTLGECEVRTLLTGSRLVMRPATDEENASDHLRRAVAHLHDDEDLWRGFWGGQWHFSDTETGLREMLADDLQAGRVPIGADTQ